MKSAILGLCLLCGFVLISQTVAEPIEIDKPFPEIVLPRIRDGEPLSIGHFRGHKVILHVFASW